MTDEECRKTCDVCWDENGGKWPCAKQSVRAAILQAATREALTPYAYVYEWDYSPGVVHRSFSSASYNGRGPDRTIQVFQASKGDGND